MTDHSSVLNQMQAHGLLVEWPLEIGRLRRCKVEGDKGGKKSGWYVVHEYRAAGGEIVYTGKFGNLKTMGPEDGVTLEVARQFTEEERREFGRAQREAAQAADEARRELARETAARAERTWPRLPEAGASDYLRRKKVRAFGLRFARGTVVVPLRNIGGDLVGLQYIGADGSKKFLTGTAKSGAFHLIGQLVDGQPLAFAEGYATAASVHQATGWPVLVTFDCANLKRVVALWREHHPEHVLDMVVCADDDSATPGNPGRTAAEEATRAGGRLALPVFPEGVSGTDWNDLHVACGIEAVRQQLTSPQGPASATPSPSHPDGEPAAAVVKESLITAQGDAATPDPQAGEEIPPGHPAGEPARTLPFGRYSLTDLLLNFKLIYGTDTCWDGINRLQMRLSALRHIVGRDLYKEWDEHAGRQITRGLVFEPSGNIPPEMTNTFDRLPLEPAPAHPGVQGACQKIIDHVWRLVNYREDEFFWLLKWIAYPLRHLGAKMDTSVIMYGSEGPGKSILWEKIVGRLYGQYAITIGQAQLESQFTGWQGGKLLATCEEVVSRSERSQHKGQLKHLVTGRTLQINEKNLPLREETNHLNFVFLSNSTVPLELDLGDRRYMVLYCGQVPPVGYFDELFREIEGGGLQAFYRYLLDLDLTGFTPHTKPPVTAEKEHLIEASLPSPALFWREWKAGHLELPYCSCQKSLLFDQFKRWCERTNEFKKRDRDFTAELRRLMREDRLDLRIPSDVSDRKTTRVWVTEEDMQHLGSSDYVAQVERSCRRFLQAVAQQHSGDRYGDAA